MIVTSDIVSSRNFIITPLFKTIDGWGAKELEHDVQLFLGELADDDASYVIHSVTTMAYHKATQGGQWYTTAIFYSRVRHYTDKEVKDE